MLSEAKKHRPNRNVIEFITRLRPQSLFVSSLTLGELHKGAQRLARKNPHDGQGLLVWVGELQTEFSERILPVTRQIALLWGSLSADRTRPVIDTLLAATAIHNGLTLVTRNTRDVQDLPVSIINPWLA